MGIRSLKSSSIATGIKRSKFWDQAATTFVPEGSAYEIASFVVPSGGLAQVTFAVPSDYRHLRLEGALLTNGATNPTWRVNGDTTSANYRGHHMWGTGVSTAANDQSGAVYWNYNPSTSYPSAFVMDWNDYNSNTKFKTMRTLAGSSTNGGTEEIAMWSGMYMSTDPITSITLDSYNGTSFSQHSKFTLIGYK